MAHLSGLLHFIKEEKENVSRNLLLFTFSGALAKTNKTFISAQGRKESRGGATIFSVYRYNVPRSPVLLDVWEQFSSRFIKVLKAKKETNDLIGKYYSSETAIISNRSATDYVGSLVEPESIDYIFTDPPYGKNIAYLDLSTMWCAWLGFPVSINTKCEEIIEGGDQNTDRTKYFKLLKKSLEEAYKALKYKRYLSLVYCHKDTQYWNTIYTAAQDIGFTYVSSQPQPLNVIWSMHKKKNALSVLSGELIVNFVKRHSTKAKILNLLGQEPIKIVKNSAELTIVKKQGASTEEILFELIPRLYENGLLALIKQKYADIRPILEEEFDYDEDIQKWQIRPNVKIGCFIPLGERIRFYVIDYLRKCQRENFCPTFDQVVMNVIPNLVNGSVPTRESILDILKEVGRPTDNDEWQLDFEKGQISLSFEKKTNPKWETPTHPPNCTQHNRVLWELLYIANKFGFSPYLGKNERKSNAFRSIPYVNEILKPIDFSSIKYSKILQIDCIWFSGKVTPIAAFEVEHSTTILSAFERFSALVEYCPILWNSKKLYIIFPKFRKRKVIKELLGSSFSKGSLPLTHGVRSIYEEEFEKFYKKYHKSFGTLDELDSIAFNLEELLLK